MQLDLRAAPENCFNQGDVALLVLDVKQSMAIVHRAPSWTPGLVIVALCGSGEVTADDGQELVDVERLGQEIGGARGEEFGDGRLAGVAAEDDDRDRGGDLAGGEGAPIYSRLTWSGPSSWQVMMTVPPARLYLIALDSRFTRIWRSRCRSARPPGRAAGRAG